MKQRINLSRLQWIERYGGQELLDAEGLDVVECDGELCDDSICHGWRVVPREVTPVQSNA